MNTRPEKMFSSELEKKAQRKKYFFGTLLFRNRQREENMPRSRFHRVCVGAYSMICSHVYVPTLARSIAPSKYPTSPWCALRAFKRKCCVVKKEVLTRGKARWRKTVFHTNTDATFFWKNCVYFTTLQINFSRKSTLRANVELGFSDFSSFCATENFGRNYSAHVPSLGEDRWCERWNTMYCCCICNAPVLIWR